jgi:hypothetical protein
LAGALIGLGTAGALFCIRKDWHKNRSDMARQWGDYAERHPNRDNKAGDRLR